MRRLDGLPKQKGVTTPRPLSRQQQALLDQLRAGWVLHKAPHWDDFTKTNGYFRLTVNTQTARALLKHGYVVKAFEAAGIVTYKVKP